MVLIPALCALRAALASDTMPFSRGSASLDAEFRLEHYQVLKNEDGIPVELGRGVTCFSEQRRLAFRLRRKVAPFCYCACPFGRKNYVPD
jgi:hypothetical protein